MKNVYFDEKLESLVDETGAKYEGRRFKTVSASCPPYGTCSPQYAQRLALFNLNVLAEKNGAEAYEVIRIESYKNPENMDPCMATVTAILYKSK